MKRLINLTLLFSMFAILACGNTSSKQPTTATETKPVAESGKPIQMDKKAFLARVYNFEKNPKEPIYLGDKPCVIDFYADWCGPCKVIAPYLAEIAGKYNGKVYVFRVNVDNEQELAQFWGIQSIPAVLFCPMKGKPSMMVGSRPKEDFYTAVEAIVSPIKK
jgi:thioredoxin